MTSSSLIHFYSWISPSIFNLNDDSESNLETSDLVYVPFNVGVPSAPVSIDPVDAYDGHSWRVISQVCEGLFKYNLSDPNLSRLNWLAESYWWEDETTLHLKLREGILFHDNTPFNANAAKWNLDRINYLVDASTPALTHELWKFRNGTGIMKQIDVVSEYNITIHLNSPFAPFLDVLCLVGGSMISPTAHSATDFIDLTTGDLVGTGPFVYDGYNVGSEVNFHAFDNYWRGEANITVMKYTIIGDSIARNNALLAGTIDYLVGPDEALYGMFQADPDIVFAEAPHSGFTYYYVGMNNNHINVSWRKAISYAIDYSYIIQNMQNDHAVRAYSPIASSFGNAYYNCSDIAPYYNLTIARQALIDDPGINTTGLTANDNPDDADWHDADLITFNYTHWGWGLWQDMAPVLSNLLDDIGITVPNFPLGYYEFLDVVNNRKHELSLVCSGWGPDYLDAFNMLNPLFCNSSESNWVPVNDPWLQMKLDEVVETIDDNARNAIYHEIQINVSSVLYPYASLFHPRVYFVYNVKLTNFPHNSFNRIDFYPCKWAATYIAIPPNVTIDIPTSIDEFSGIPPTFSLTIDALDYDTIWYTLDNGVTNKTCGTSGQIDSTLWTSLADGTHTLTFYANNSLGLIGTATVSIYKDATDPVIVINDPDPGQEFTTTIPTYDITVTETNLESVWYSMDDGVTNIPITTYSGTVDEATWLALPEGQVTITFYAVDTVGNIGSASVIVNKSVPAIPPGISGPYPVLILLILFTGIIGLVWRHKQKLN